MSSDIVESQSVQEHAAPDCTYKPAGSPQIDGADDLDSDVKMGKGDDVRLLQEDGNESRVETKSASSRPASPVIVFVYIGIIAMANVLFGFENSNISGAKTDFAKDFGITDTAQIGFLVGGMPIGAMVACIFAGFLQDGLGRRVTLCISNLVYIAATLVCYNATGYAMLAAGRVIVGLAIGTLSSTVPMFIAELSPAHLRGTLVTINQVCICTGILLGYGACKALSPNWRLELVVGAPVSGLLFLAFAFVTPYSPRWLMSKGREEEARVVLHQIRLGGEFAVEAEISNIKASIATSRSGNAYAKLREPHVLWAVAIGVMAATMQQWCGVNAVNGYAQTIFQDAGFSASESANGAIYIGVAKLVFVMVALGLMDVVGRKVLLLIGSVGMGVCLVALGIIFTLFPDPKTIPQSAGFGASASLIVYMAFFEISLGPVLWLLLSELYPLQVKGMAMSIGSFTTWMFTYTVAQLYPILNLSSLGVNGTFFLFAAVCAFSFVWIRAYLPETKGRTLEEIEDDLRASVGMTTSAEMAANNGGNIKAEVEMQEGKGLFKTLSVMLGGAGSAEEAWSP